MDINALKELFHFGGMAFGVGILLVSALLVAHFFTRHMTNMIHRVTIIFAVLCLLGILWHVFHPIIHTELEKIDLYISSAIWIVTFFSAAYLVNRLVDKYVWQQIFIDVKKGEMLSTSFMRSVIAGLIYGIFVLLIMLFVFKKELHGLWALVGGSTLLLGYAGTDVIKELFAGMALNINPAFKKGDFLKIKDHQAKILDINWRYVVLEDITANLLFVPNTEMLHHLIYNYSGTQEATRACLSFRVHPNVPPQFLVDILTPELKKLSHLAKRDWYQDNVIIHIKNCDEQSMEFAVELLVDHFEHLYEMKTIAYKIIWYTLNHHEIPMLVYRMRVNFPEKNYSQMSRLWNQKLSKKGIGTLLKKSFLFAVCSKSEITLLSNHAILHEFVPDQHLYSEGDDGDVLFVIQSGAVQLTKKMPSGDVLVTKILKPLDAAGVNAVMTGQKRERSAVALTHVQAYVIKRDVLNQIFDKYHTRIQHVVDQIVYEEELRNRDFQSYLEKRTREEEKIHKSIIGKVREFVGISKR